MPYPKHKIRTLASRVWIGIRFRDVEQEVERARSPPREGAIRRFAHLSAVEELGKRARGPRSAMSSFHRGSKDGRRRWRRRERGVWGEAVSERPRRGVERPFFRIAESIYWGVITLDNRRRNCERRTESSKTVLSRSAYLRPRRRLRERRTRRQSLADWSFK